MLSIVSKVLINELITTIIIVGFVVISAALKFLFSWRHAFRNLCILSFIIAGGVTVYCNTDMRWVCPFWNMFSFPPSRLELVLEVDGIYHRLRAGVIVLVK